MDAVIFVVLRFEYAQIRASRVHLTAGAVTPVRGYAQLELEVRTIVCGPGTPPVHIRDNTAQYYGF